MPPPMGGFMPGANPDMRAMGPRMHNSAPRFQGMAGGSSRPPYDPTFQNRSCGPPPQNQPHMHNQGRFSGPPPGGFNHNAGLMQRGCGFVRPPPFSHPQQNVSDPGVPHRHGDASYHQPPPMQQQHFPLPPPQPGMNIPSSHHMSRPPPSHHNSTHFHCPPNIRSANVNPTNSRSDLIVLGVPPSDMSSGGKSGVHHHMPSPHPPSHQPSSHHSEGRYPQRSHQTDGNYGDTCPQQTGRQRPYHDRDRDKEKGRFCDSRDPRERSSSTSGRKRRDSPNRRADRREASHERRSGSASSRSR